MNIQARRISGSSFSAEDRLELVFDAENQSIHEVVHTVELISGVGVTHGGGSPAGEYLHYKSQDRDANSEGVIDYSKVEMHVTQVNEGISVIRAVCQVVTKTMADTFMTETEAYVERKKASSGLEEEFTEVAPTLESTVFKTGNITLEWTEDTFV